MDIQWNSNYTRDSKLWLAKETVSSEDRIDEIKVHNAGYRSPRTKGGKTAAEFWSSAPLADAYNQDVTKINVKVVLFLDDTTLRSNVFMLNHIEPIDHEMTYVFFLYYLPNRPFDDRAEFFSHRLYYNVRPYMFNTKHFLGFLGFLASSCSLNPLVNPLMKKLGKANFEHLEHTASFLKFDQTRPNCEDKLERFTDNDPEFLKYTVNKSFGLWNHFWLSIKWTGVPNIRSIEKWQQTLFHHFFIGNCIGNKSPKSFTEDEKTEVIVRDDIKELGPGINAFSVKGQINYKERSLSDTIFECGRLTAINTYSQSYAPLKYKMATIKKNVFVVNVGDALKAKSLGKGTKHCIIYDFSNESGTSLFKKDLQVTATKIHMLRNHRKRPPFPVYQHVLGYRELDNTYEVILEGIEQFNYVFLFKADDLVDYDLHVGVKNVPKNMFVAVVDRHRFFEQVTKSEKTIYQLQILESDLPKQHTQVAFDDVNISTWLDNEKENHRVILHFGLKKREDDKRDVMIDVKQIFPDKLVEDKAQKLFYVYIIESRCETLCPQFKITGKLASNFKIINLASGSSHVLDKSSRPLFDVSHGYPVSAFECDYASFLTLGVSAIDARYEPDWESRMKRLKRGTYLTNNQAKKRVGVNEPDVVRQPTPIAQNPFQGMDGLECLEDEWSESDEDEGEDDRTSQWWPALPTRFNGILNAMPSSMSTSSLVGTAFGGISAAIGAYYYYF